MMESSARLRRPEEGVPPWFKPEKFLQKDFEPEAYVADLRRFVSSRAVCSYLSLHEEIVKLDPDGPVSTACCVAMCKLFLSNRQGPNSSTRTKRPTTWSTYVLLPCYFQVPLERLGVELQAHLGKLQTKVRSCFKHTARLPPLVIWLQVCGAKMAGASLSKLCQAQTGTDSVCCAAV